MKETSFSGFLGIDVSKDKFDAYCIEAIAEQEIMAVLKTKSGYLIYQLLRDRNNSFLLTNNAD